MSSLGRERMRWVVITSYALGYGNLLASMALRKALAGAPLLVVGGVLIVAGVLALSFLMDTAIAVVEGEK